MIQQAQRDVILKTTW